MLTPNPAIPNIANTPDVATPLSFGPARPLMLLPVRLETRFFKMADGGSELRVRVYPDNVHIDSHEPELTPEEVTWGKHFWEQTWRAATDDERAKAAWRQLADRFDPPRAAWIARALKPLNPDNHRPQAPIGSNVAFTNPPIFPATASKAEAWTRAPRTRVLPSFWIALGYKDGRLVVNAKGSPIPDSLATGPDPNVIADPAAPPDQLAIDEGMKWMIDFDAAQQEGMGIRARLNAQDTAAGLDFLLVLGVKDSPGGTTDWTPRLTELFNAHHYTNGLSFVRQSTPSNNTSDAPSGFSSGDPGHAMSWAAERASNLFLTGDRSNADVLTTALGLANAGGLLGNLTDANEKEQVDARHMNTALWQGTMGYFLLQMLGVGGTNESRLEDADIEWARNHFVNFVRGSGPLPALRIGKQPYGVLPVTSLKEWNPPAGQAAPDGPYARDLKLKKLLNDLRQLWRGNFPDVPRLGRSTDIDQQRGIATDLAEVLSMDGLSSSYSIRNLMGRHYLEHLWIFLSADYYKDVWAPLGEPPEEPPPFEEEPAPEDLTGQALIRWLRAQNEARQAAARAHTQWVAQMAFFQQQANLISAKLAATPAWWATQEQRTKALLDTLGIPRPRVARGVFAPPVVKLDGALVQKGDGLMLSPNYIDMLLAARDVESIRDEKVQPPSPSLLYLLLRHSMLLEYGAAGAQQLGLAPDVRREPELVHLAGLPTQTVWQQLDTNVDVTGGSVMKLREFLLGPSGEPVTSVQPHLKRLSDFRASLTHLKSLPVERLEDLMTGTLDLCSHRLDAWITSFATKRLAEMRNANPTGILVGGYGWVMNLKPEAAQVPVPTPPGEQGPVLQLANNPGFVHAPSLTQAAAVAVLRSGHLAHSGNDNPNDLLSIDLSSERVRLATWLLDGVRQGQPLGALLGYRFERRLQERNRARFISTFRQFAPLVAGKLEPTASNQSLEAIGANNVVDGLRLHDRWQPTQADPLLAPQKEQEFFNQLPPNTPPMTSQERADLRQELNALHDAVDSLSDALMAESVYQVVRGNPLRAAGTVESIAGGEAPPPELEVVRTPRTGIALTHRVVTLFSGDPVLPTDWAPAAIPFRSNAEPHLNAWAAKLLRNPFNVRCLVDRLEPGTGKVLETREIRLNQLRQGALDFIYAVEGDHAEMEQKICYGIQRKADGFPPGSLLRVNPGRRPSWPATDLGYGEFNEMVRAARKVITGARALDAGDLDLPERSTDFNVDIAELESRVASAEVWLRRTPNDFKALLVMPDTANLDAMRDLIIRASTFGVAGSVPLSAAGNSAEDRRVLLAQGASIQKELAQRVEQLTALIAGFNPTTATVEARRDHAIARLRIAFGKDFVVLPRFTAANATELEKALADSTKVQSGDPLASTTWFQRMARVRDGVGRLEATLNYAEAINTGDKLKLTIAQLPYGADDRWVGLPLQPGKNLPGGKLSIAVQSAAAVDVRKPLAGILIDEWVETVPSATETTGIALQYDRPSAAPPQTILLAVPPVPELPWTVWSLQQVLLETLDLARIRAVDPDALDDVGQFFPALYFAINTNNDTVSTDFLKIRT